MRPHHQLKGITPAEAYAGHKVELVDVAKKYRMARVGRAMANRSGRCKFCIGLNEKEKVNGSKRILWLFLFIRFFLDSIFISKILFGGTPFDTLSVDVSLI